ncbi:MAG: ROK family protein, partial [Candidatus Spyradocola sp.]
MQSRIGIDLGGSHFSVGVFGEDAQLLVVRSFAHPADRSVPSMARAIAAAARECLGDAGLGEKDVVFCGIGMPSCIHPVTQRLVHSNNLGWIDCKIYPDFRAALPWELRIENDANCAAIGEAKLGAGAGYKNLLMLTLGTGVGGGVILDGRLYTGADRMGAELGHVKLVHQGRRCTCGQLGCLESYASATAFVAMAKEELPSHPDSLL